MDIISLGVRKFVPFSRDIDRNTHYYESEPRTVFCTEGS